MSGPPKTPTAILEARGSRLAKGREGEPAPQAGLPARPKWLKRRAIPHWNELIDILTPMNVLTVADGTTLAMLADAMADYVEASEDVAERGLLVDGRENCKVKNPSVQFKAAAFDRILSLGARFGIDPSSRARLRITNENHIEDAEDKELLG